MKLLIPLIFATLLPLSANAAEVRVTTPSIKVDTHDYRIGDRDKRGYYWDGGRWIDQGEWDKKHGKGNGGCPPGQAKKGRC